MSREIPNADFDAGWDDAIDASARTAMVLQDGFRKLLVSKRDELLQSLDLERPAATGAEYKNVLAEREAKVKELEHEVSSGEALVGVLGDVIRKIASLKKKPR